MILNKRIFVGALSAVLMLLSVCGLSAQEVSSLSMRELQNEAQGYIKQKKYIDARPYLEELVLRTNESASASLKSNLAEYYYFWAYGYLQEYANSSNPDDLKKAIAKFETGIKEFPMSNYANASIETMARCYDSLRDFAAATNTRKMLLEKPYVDRLNYAAQLGIIKKIAETLYVNREWKLGLEWFQMLFDRSKDPNDKVFAASALVQADIANEDYEAVKKYIPYMVYDVPARYDIALSLAFLTAGDALAKKRQFSDAALFYNMVLSKESIASNINRFLADAKKKLERINRTSPGSEIAVNLDNTVKYYEAVLKMVEGVRSYDSDIMAREGNNYLQTKRMYESFWSFWRIIKEYPDSEGEDAFYYAAIESALNIGKDEAMHDLAVEYIEKYPDGDHIVPVKLRLAQYLLKKKEYDSFFELTKQFIDDYYDDDKAPDFIFLMGRAWLETKDYDDMLETLNRYIEEYEGEILMESAMYWCGIGNMSVGNFDEAVKLFKRQLEETPEGVYAEDGTYRLGVAAYATGDFPLASSSLKDFISKYPNSKQRGEVEFFLGDIYANDGQPELAMEHYAQVENYTQTQVFIDNSYLQRARLLHAGEKYADEIALMESYMEKYPEARISEASYNIAKAKEVSGLPADAMKIYEKVILEHGGDKDDESVDKIVLDYSRMYADNFEKTKATIGFLEELTTNQALLRDMVEVPAKRYRYFVDNPKIDKRLYESFKRDKAYGPILYKNKKLLSDLIAVYRGQLDLYPEGGAEGGYKSMLEKAKAAQNLTMEYRLMMGLDNMGAPLETAKMFSPEDLKLASVRTLVWMGKVAEKYGAEEGRKAYDEALSRGPSEYTVDALFGEASLEEHATNWDKVLEIYQRILDEFPSDSRASKAMISLGDALSKLGKNSDAFEKYENVLKSPWSNNAKAEALYKMGLSSLAENKTDEAIMYFERCYLGYGSSLDWTGKSVIELVKIYKKSGQVQQAKEVVDEFLRNKLNEASPDYREVKELGLTL